jgi:uncharacterized membrane protein
MEKTRNSVIDLFKNFGLAIRKLVNDGEVDDVELTGELAKDPIEALKEYEASVKSVEEPVQAKTQNREKVQTREASAVKRTTRATTRKEPIVKIVDDDEREM